MIKQRVITALVLAPALVALLLFAPSDVVAVVFAAVILTGGWEWSVIAVGDDHKVLRLGYVAAIATGLVAAALIEIPLNLYLLVSMLWWATALVIIVVFQRSAGQVSLGKTLKGVACFLILLPSWLLLVRLHRFENGHYLLLLLFLVIWAADTGAYFAGRWRGKTKLAFYVSPGKTVEGLIGGLIAAGIVAWAGGYFLGQRSDVIVLTVVGVVSAAMSVIGDLVESYYKRLAGVKDSGSVFPGHGGVMDRIDSLTAAAPVYVGGLYFAGVIA